MIQKDRTLARKEVKLMRPVLIYLGLLLSFLVLVFGLVHIGEPYLFALLAVSVLLIGVGVLTNT